MTRPAGFLSGFALGFAQAMVLGGYVFLAWLLYLGLGRAIELVSP